MTPRPQRPSEGRVGLHRIPLEEWTLRLDPDGPTEVPGEALALVGRRLPAQVPGAVHDDLQRAGLIPDPLLGDNESAVAWVSRTDWEYSCPIPTVPAAAGAERIDLVFDGLDTVARVELDGTDLGRTRNMHRSHRFDATALVAAGADHLTVHLTSAYTEAQAQLAALGPRPNSYPEPFNFVRKMACSFGWDWGPTVVGAGIWRPVRLECWGTARISRVRPIVDVADGTGEVTVLLDLERAASGSDGTGLRAEVLLDGNPIALADVGPEDDSAELRVRVGQPRIWNPVGYGSANLYSLQVRLLGPDGTQLDIWERRVGFRHLQLDRSVDEDGTRFMFVVNGEPVLVKGVNWIPDDIMPGRMTRARYATRLRQARDAGANLVRVWGGGLYETDEFYDAADELGLLVWQDFPFACAAYPEEEPIRGEVLAEAAENVARLMPHPSLVLWNGNNENLWLHEAEGWARQPGGDAPWGTRYYLEDLPCIVAETDPSRPYTAGSPWSGSWEHAPNDPAHQTHHSWDVWNRLDYQHYRDSVPRFVAEFGWQAPAAWATLRGAVADEPLTPTSPGIRHRQKATGGMDKLRRGLAPHVPIPDDFDAWHYLTQWNQVRAIETGVLHWRSHWPRTAGTIVWQLNDIWPALSWSAIDSAGRAKPLYHALREMYADRVLTIQPVGDTLEWCALNDSPEPWVGEALLRRVGDDGGEAGRTRVAVRVPPRSVLRQAVPDHLIAFGDPAAEVLVVDLGACRSHWYAGEPKDSAFAGDPPDIEVVAIDGGLCVTVTARTVLRDFLVQPDHIHPDATADRGFLTLLPGESVTVTVRCPEPLRAESVRAPFAVAWLDAVIHGACPSGSGKRV